jgi:hypothetical protein
LYSNTGASKTILTLLEVPNNLYKNTNTDTTVLSKHYKELSAD